MENKKKSMIVIGIIVLIIFLTPVGIGLGVSLPIFKNIDNSNDWIGFWGGYLGSIFGGLVTLYVLWSTISNEQKSRKKEEKEHFFEKIVELFSKFSTMSGNVCTLAMRLISDHSNSLYRSLLLLENDLAGITIEMEILLHTREDIYDCHEFMDKLTDLNSYISDLLNNFDYTSDVGNINQETADKIDKDTDQILDRIVELNQILIECVKNNLDLRL